MERLVRVVSQLEDVLLLCKGEQFEFPQLVVVGEQSSGKSSVLEGLVGTSFLPRGTGTVTRRPLLLRLQTIVPGAKGEAVDRVVFSHTDVVFTDFSLVMKEIQDETDRIAGSNKGISSEPIHVTFYSRNAASNLTLIDLPGIVKVPMGDQPDDIESQIHDLVLKYISNPNSIILAVVTANTDIATSESLKIAREVDPLGERTLAVVTKLDLMDAGTNAEEILTGNIICAKLGIIGVVNRSQRDIMQGKSIMQSSTEETEFFIKNYPMIAHRHGTSYLAKTLQSLLINHVKSYLPQLKTKIQSALSYYSNHLKSLSNNNLKAPNESLLQLLTNFTSSYNAKIQGQSNELDTHEIGGGARMSYIFHEVFYRALDSINPLEGYSRSGILTAVKNSSGTKPCLFVPETCFEILVKKQITRLEAPSLRCVKLIYDEMEKILYNIGEDGENEISRYPKLSKRIIDVGLSLLKSRLPETETLVQRLIGIQGAYINTAHPDFKKVDRNFHHTSDSQLLPLVEENSPTVLMIERLIVSYFDIVRKTVQDMVPKAIMYSFVNHVMEHLLPELVSQLYKSSQENSILLEESIALVEQKNRAQKMMETLERASTIIATLKEEKCLQ